MNMRLIGLSLLGLGTLVPSSCVEYNFHNLDGLSPDGLEGIDPVAICRASPNPAHPLLEQVEWDGSDSYDPEGEEIVEYQWSLAEVPEGSQSLLPLGDNPRLNGFIPDLAGTYTGQLIVVTADGRSSQPCEVDLDVIPAEELWIEMFWSHGGDDMDLHLLAPGGQLETESDCFYMNCVDEWGPGLDWGSRGDSVDDPHLDLDDIEGLGPENINIQVPDEGRYEIVVHDYPGSVRQQATEVTVKIYIMGELHWEGSRMIEGENRYIPFASFSWPEGEIQEL
jgi:hypothetical protein